MEKLKAWTMHGKKTEQKTLFLKIFSRYSDLKLEGRDGWHDKAGHPVVCQHPFYLDTPNVLKFLK